MSRISHAGSGRPTGWCSAPRIIDLAADGVSTYAIARRLGCCEATVRKWRARMAASPCALHGGRRAEWAARDDPHRGAAHRGAARLRRSAGGRACSEVPRGLDARFAARCRGGGDRRQDQRLGGSRDPAVRGALAASCRRLAAQPRRGVRGAVEARRRAVRVAAAGAVVLSVDEKTGIQATTHPPEPCGPARPPSPGVRVRPQRDDHDDRRAERRDGPRARHL
ncbi:MAG: helix-turn-helix domain-containing protein [Polyangiaceae bacterium]|nr:helix-turn-helix domain-containing protein [Polyangiaceae bacterium]